MCEILERVYDRLGESSIKFWLVHKIRNSVFLSDFCCEEMLNEIQLMLVLFCRTCHALTLTPV